MSVCGKNVDTLRACKRSNRDFLRLYTGNTYILSSSLSITRGVLRCLLGFLALWGQKPCGGNNLTAGATNRMRRLTRLKMLSWKYEPIKFRGNSWGKRQSIIYVLTFQAEGGKQFEMSLFPSCGPTESCLMEVTKAWKTSEEILQKIFSRGLLTNCRCPSLLSNHAGSVGETSFKQMIYQIHSVFSLNKMLKTGSYSR